MDGGHVWSVPTFGSDDGSPSDDKIFNSIMLRFRPIAPKPVAGTSATAAGDSRVDASLQGKRTKRKYVRIRRNSGYVRKNGNKSSEKSVEKKEKLENVAIVTLQLLPEKEAPENENPSPVGDSWCNNLDLDLTVEKIQILEDPKPPHVAEVKADAGEGLDSAAAKAVESWVTVESVTGTCIGEGGGGGLGCTDVEKLNSLETDTCPGFVSDGCWSVRWVNEAYKRMVESEGREVVVRLKVKETVNNAWCYSHPAFTCGVRLQYTWRNEKYTKMVPCDVWRLDCGGFAWRLDVKTALSLGL